MLRKVNEFPGAVNIVEIYERTKEIEKTIVAKTLLRL
jgi:hypothetical protein